MVNDVCECCSRARQCPMYGVFTPACLWCGARLFRRLGDLEPVVGARAVRQRRVTVLDDWERHGHSRTELRTLALGPDVPLAPLPGSDAPTAAPEPRKGRKGRG